MPSPLPSVASAISIEHTTKRYDDDLLALDDVSLRVEPGAFIGLLGPNGAGKSTLINILGGLVLKDSGRVSLWERDLDVDPRNARAAIGIVPQEVYMDPFFTPYAMLELCAGLYGLRRAERWNDTLLERLGLGSKKHVTSRSLSGGMKRRMMVAKALVHRPPILVLDEPTAGVDVLFRKHLWAFVQEMHAQGTTILLTTHYLEEAEALCEKIAIIDGGKIVAYDKTSTLIARLATKSLHIVFSGKARPKLRETLRLPEQAHIVSCSKHSVEIAYNPQKVAVAELLAAVSDKDVSIQDLNTKEPSLEEVFLQATQQGFPPKKR